MHGATLPGRFPEDLFYSPDQSLVGIGCDEFSAGGAAVALRLQETGSRVIRLRVRHRYAGHPPPAGVISADCRRRGGRCYAVSLDVGRVKPDAGYCVLIERLLRQVCYLGVEARDDCARAVPAEPFDTHLGGDLLRLPCAGAGGVHFGHRRYEGPVHTLIALEGILGEDTARPEFVYSQVARAHTCLETAASVAVPAVDHMFCKQPEQRLDVCHPLRRLRYRGSFDIASANIPIATPFFS